MLISLNWLKDFVKLPETASVGKVANKLTMSTVEVEEIIDSSKSLADIVLAKVVSIDKHPDADKLHVCTVDDGKAKHKVVCGGSNVVENMLVAFAPLGSKVRWHGEGELVELKKVKIRGVESSGMICASTEIGLGEMFVLADEKEILDLTDICATQKIGMSLAKALNMTDVAIDIDNKSMTHRPDLWGHYGMAREVAALYNTKLIDYNPATIKEGSKNLKVAVKDKELCPRYMAVEMSGIKVAPSPAWMQARLAVVGLRPINNIVDITNYVMYELGQPMHAFDSTLVDGEIVVRRAEENEIFTTLDGDEHKLDNRDLVIADKNKAIALAGIMGGENSEINEETQTIIFESANFDATNIRRSSMRLGLRTDSSSRFEKSLDPANCELALRKAVELVLQICPQAKVVSKVADSKSYKEVKKVIDLSLDFLDRKIGQTLEKKQIINILEGLGFMVKDADDELEVTVPSWRATKDISIAEDLVEEVSRIYGYDNIEPVMPLFAITPPEVNELRNLERKLSDILVGNLKYNEVYTYSFVSAKQINNIGENIDQYLQLDNPISKEKPYIRRCLLLNLLESVKKNLEFFEEVRIFEIGKTYLVEKKGKNIQPNSKDVLPLQDNYLTAVYSSKKDDNSFWKVKKIVEEIAKVYGLDLSLQESKKIKRWQHKTRVAVVKVGESEIGYVSELNPVTMNLWGIDSRVGVVNINIDKLLEQTLKAEIKYSKLSPYPEVSRDISMIVKNDTSHEDIKNVIIASNDLVRSVELFDIYKGKNIGDGYKSMAYHIVYGSDEKTLTAVEVDDSRDKLIELLEKKFSAQVRK